MDDATIEDLYNKCIEKLASRSDRRPPRSRTRSRKEVQDETLLSIGERIVRDFLNNGQQGCLNIEGGQHIFPKKILEAIFRFLHIR